MTLQRTLRSLFLLVLSGWAAVLSAQTINSNSSEAFPLMSLGIGPRSIGMGEAFTAVSDDFSAVHYNPAGLGQVWQPQLFMSHQSYLESSFYETAGFVDPMKAGTLALGLSYINYGNFDLRDSTGTLLGGYTPFDMVARGAFGFPLTNNLYAGLGSVWLRQQITSSVYTALVWNFGFLWKPSAALGLGLSFQNLGVDNINYDLPTQISAGASYKIELAPKQSQTLLLSGGGDLSLESLSHLNAGFEYTFLRNYFLRGGYLYDLQDQGLGWEQGLSFGAGIKFSQFQMDYSYTFEGDLGNVQTVALTVYFPPFVKPTPEPKVSAMAPVTVYLPSLPVVIKVTPNPTPVVAIAPTRGETANTGLLSANDKNPVMLRFQITSQDDMTANQLFELAETKFRSGLRDEALGLYVKATQKDPNFDPAWSRLARLYFEDSIDAYRHVLQMEPQNAALREWLSHFNQMTPLAPASPQK